MTAPTTTPPGPSIADLRDRHPALRAAELWRGGYSRALYALVPDGRLAWADEGHAAEFARRRASVLAARQPTGT